MAMEIDELQIEIESDASNASAELDKLSGSLINLKNSLNGADKLRSFSTALKNLSSISKETNSAEFTKIANGISKISKSLEGLNNFKTGATGFLKELSYIKNTSKSLNEVEFDKFESNINSLKAALEPLSSLEPTNLNKYVTSLKSIPALLNGFDLSGFKNQVGELANSLGPLESLGNTNLSGFLNQLKKLPEISSTLNKISFTAFSSQMKGLANALKPLEDVGKTNIGSFLNQLKKLPEISRNLNNVDFAKFTKQMKQLASAITPLNGISIKLGRAFSNLPWHIKKASSQLDKYSTSANKATKSSGSLVSRLGKSVASFRTLSFVVQGFVGALATVFEESSQYVENLNLFNVAMGETTQSAMEYAEKVQAAMGIDMGEWMSYQGRLNNLMTGFDVTAEQAQIMSQNLTQLAYDYSSLMNVDVAESFDKINSAMSGQIKGLKDYGNNVSVAMVKQTGLKYGLEGAVSEWDQNTQAIMRYITIMNNASKVDVFNDMARTIATPANSIRILTAQFTQLKRAIGNIASVFITKLVPYVQIAVQWLTALANTIANFFGFSLPEIDYSGIAGGGSALDDVEESAGDAGDAVGGTTDKVKELKKQLMGFDELNIINKPDDDSDSGGGGSGGGAGGGGSIGNIELPQYDFLKGLENQTQEMMDRLAKKMAEMFEPVTASWDKYGQGVLDSIYYQWTEIGKLVDSIGNSFSTVWHNGTGEETMDHIFQIVTNLNNSVGNLAKRFREAWDEAGKGTAIIQNIWNAANNLLECVEWISDDFEEFTDNLDFNPLLESIVDLTEVFEDLSETVGEYLYDAYKNVLEPLAKWGIEKALPSLIKSFSSALDGVNGALKNLRPLISILEKLATLVGKIVGNVILKGLELLAKTLEAVGNNKILLAGLTTVVTGLIAAMAFGKVINDLGKLNGIFSLLKMAVIDIKNLGFTNALSSWTQAFGNNHSAVKNLMTGLVNLKNTILGGVTSALSSVGQSTGLITTSTDGATKGVGFLGTAMNFLAQHPAVLVVGAVTALSLAFVALMNDTNGLTTAQEKQIEKSQELAKECNKLAEEQKKLNEAGAKEVESINKKYDATSMYVTKLGELVDENGRVTGSMEQAQYYVDAINDALGTNITITDGAIENWKEEKKAIDDTIASMKQKAKVQAYEEQYVAALKEESKVRANLTKAQDDYDKALSNYMDSLSKYGATYDDYINKTDAYYEAQSKLNAQGDKTGYIFSEAEKALNSAKSAMAQNTEATKNYESALGALDGTMESTVASIVEEYGIMTKDGHYTYDSLKAGIADLNDALDENGERYKQLSETEREASRLAREQLISDCITKSVQLGKSYDEMKEKLGSAWDTMTSDEKKALKEQYDIAKTTYEEQKNTLLEILDKYNIDRNSKQALQWQKELEDAQTNGADQGQKYVENLASEMEKNKSKTDQQGLNIATGIKNAIESNPGIIRVDDSQAQGKFNEWNRKTLDPKTLKIIADVSIPGTGAYGITALKKLGLFAVGGFPEMGEMFIARESGPELVGRIGRKNAVANNDQIVSGVSNGVYNAVRSAMSGMNNSGGKFEIHTTVVLDNMKVGKSVIDYHNGIVRQTGKSPLNV